MIGSNAKMVAAPGTNMEVLGKLLPVQDLSAPVTFFEDVGGNLPPVFRLEWLLFFAKPGHETP
jgi:hypothetical protein